MLIFTKRWSKQYGKIGAYLNGISPKMLNESKKWPKKLCKVKDLNATRKLDTKSFRKTTFSVVKSHIWSSMTKRTSKLTSKRFRDLNSSWQLIDWTFLTLKRRLSLDNSIQNILSSKRSVSMVSRVRFSWHLKLSTRKFSSRDVLKRIFCHSFGSTMFLLHFGPIWL